MNQIFRSFFAVPIFAMGLSACGQPGPLYLPKDQPSVYDEPKPIGEQARPPQNNRTENERALPSSPASADQPSQQ